ncbi:BRCT domain-containing DNA repair protein [Euphorbia peplus]|nr:BRCT domain-containing DNA repair protein [Euphorbia peplus]
MGGVGKVEVISSKGCSRLFLGLSSSFRPFDPMSLTTSSIGSDHLSAVRSTAPFSALVICVTGLSKEARKQVMEATERLGGQYSPNLHPQCTHLVVQSFGGRKFEHALKHGSKNGLFVVTLGWFVDSVRRNVRLSESLYSVKTVGGNDVKLDDLNRLVGFGSTENSCLPAGINDAKQFDMAEGLHKRLSGRSSNRSTDSTLSGSSIYIDSGMSDELRNKVYEAAFKEGASFVDRWFVGCSASHVVCEGASVKRYFGHSNNLVTPFWVLKTAKEKHVQRLVHVSADLARQVVMMLENLQNGFAGQESNGGSNPQDIQSLLSKVNCEDRQRIVNLAKNEVRSRRVRRMQTCQTPIRPITPSSLLDSISWSISESTSTASLYTDTLSAGDVSGYQTPLSFDTKEDTKDSEASFTNLTRPLTESEKSELILKNHFLTILFPVDRFSEMGPSSRTYFSQNGFTCLQVLDHIYAYYQENMTASEIEGAIHTDSRHADRLRAVYSSKKTAEVGYVIFKRIDFLGSRRSFEMLKRVPGDNNSNVYELLLRA